MDKFIIKIVNKKLLKKAPLGNRGVNIRVIYIKDPDFR